MAKASAVPNIGYSRNGRLPFIVTELGLLMVETAGFSNSGCEVSRSIGVI